LIDELGRSLDLEQDLLSLGTLCPHPAHGVHVARHEVSAEQVPHRERALEIDELSLAEPTERGLR
jgi:hypothetical protein